MEWRHARELQRTGLNLCRLYKSAPLVSHCIPGVRHADFLGAVTITMSETELPTQDRMLYMVLLQYGHCAFGIAYEH